MKTCVTCLKEKPEEEFNFKITAKGLRSSSCRECKKETTKNLVFGSSRSREGTGKAQKNKR